MEEKTLNALNWIVGILTKHRIPYRIGGGLAAHVYGSPRPVNDIDLFQESLFQRLFRKSLDISQQAPNII